MGYTLVELVIVLAVMGLVGTIGFFGLKPATEAEKLANAGKELLVNLRSAQNSSIAGKNGGATTNIIFNASSYRVGAITYSLPTGVTLMVNPPATTICLVNPNAITSTCGSCANSFSCPVASVVTLQLTGQNGPARTVVVEGAGLFVNRIYAP